jgi:hypothetical protein
MNARKIFFIWQSKIRSSTDFLLIPVLKSKVTVGELLTLMSSVIPNPKAKSEKRKAKSEKGITSPFKKARIENLAVSASS